MADIKYLAGLDIDGNITLNGNQLVSAAINSGSSDPTGLSAGQLFLDQIQIDLEFMMDQHGKT